MPVTATLTPLETFLGAAYSDTAYEALTSVEAGGLQTVAYSLLEVEDIPEILDAQETLHRDQSGADSQEALLGVLQTFLHHFGVRRRWFHIALTLRQGGLRFAALTEATARAERTLTPPSTQIHSDESKFREALVRNNKNFQGIDFTQVPIKMLQDALHAHSDLFVGANLYGAKFAGMDLTGFNFEGALMTGADLSGATLVGAKLKRAKLILAKLEGANLVGTDLSETDLISANLKGAVLIGTGITKSIALKINAKFSDATQFDRALPPPLPV